MECSKCHREIKDPLELYTGDTACPKCRGNLSSYPKRFSAVNPRAREFFSLAELYYHYSLCKSARLPTTGLIDKSTLTAEKMVEKAVFYCSEAAKLGHPEALWRLAFFYDKDYLEKETSETVRSRIAANMYLAIVSAPELQFEGYGEDETVALKRRCADDLFCMLRGMHYGDRKAYTDKLIENGYLTAEAVRELAKETGKSGAEELVSLLKRATSKRKAPLFGIIRIKKEQLERMAEEISKNPAVAQRKLDLMFIPLNKEGTYDFRNSIGGSSPYHIVRSSQAAIKEGIALASEKSEGSCCVYFFNKAGKHRFYGSASKKSKIQKLLNNDMIDRLISNSIGRSFTFYDDDVFMKNGRADKIVTEISAIMEV